MPPSEFRKHWLGTHGTFAAKLPHLRKYQQNHVVDSRQLGIDFPRGNWNLDGFSELWFDDFEAMRGDINSDVYRPVSTDTPKLMDMPGIIISAQNQVIPLLADPGPMVKRMAILERKPGISAATFQHEWWNVHAGKVSKMPGVLGYTQNLVIDREVTPGASAPYSAVPIDGVVELWFRDVQSVEHGFASPAGKEVVAHAQTFIGEITTYLVETHEIV
jgi:uncharacterized protein (TIGR02118 family)